jgi:hypothetical protein
VVRFLPMGFGACVAEFRVWEVAELCCGVFLQVGRNGVESIWWERARFGA